MNWPVVVREKSPGIFTASPAGLLELSVEAPNRSEALNKAAKMLHDMAIRGELTTVFLPMAFDVVNRTCGVDPNDPIQLEYEAELARYRKEDLDRTNREIDELERREAEQLKAG